ncbi:hypothetical protein TYRP_022221 [Tyrophagus putrescentiae]|nr:hypothetical protein TYRP_022221 [Tyrophagus putrescentiae]
MRGHLEEEWQKLGAGMLFGLHHSRRISCFLGTLRDLAISALLLALIFAASYASVSISSVADPLAHFFNGSLADHHNSSNATSTASVEFMM